MIPLILQDSIDRETLQTFLDARNDIKKPMTERAVKMLVNKLTRLEKQGHCPNLLLERSIIGGWQDVYPDESTRKVQAEKQSFVETHFDRSWWGIDDNVRRIR